MSEMKLEQPVKGFYVGERSGRRYQHLSEITVGEYFVEGGGCRNEFAISWISLGSKETQVEPRLEVFASAWEVFENMPELMGLFRFGFNRKPAEVIQYLVDHGYRNLTREPVAGETERESAISLVAHVELGISCLQPRHSDHLDFHNLSVWEINNALKAAYEKGREAGR